MRRLALVLILVFLPTVVQAACSANGYTVVFVNGIFDTKQDAYTDMSALQNKLGSDFNGQPLTVKVGYNQTHIAGLGDLAELAFPALDQLDLDTILRQMHDEVQTRKILIVGHSQGASYANKIYDYLITHGEPKDAVAIYAVGTPEPIPSGKGTYLNFEGDDTIYGPLASKVIHPPPFNVSSQFFWTSTTTDGGSYKGHNFVDEYLATFPNIISSNIKTELFVLRPTYASDTLNECFTAPENTLGQQVESTGLAVADFYANSIVGVTQQGYGEAVFALGVGGKVLGIAGDVFGTVASAVTPKPPDPNKERAANDAAFAAVKAIYGSSLDVKDVDQLQRDAQKKNNNSLSGAAILALMPDEPASTSGEVLGSSTEATSTVPSLATTTPTPFPTSPVPMPGENVHYNAPTFGGLAAVQEDVPQEEVSSSSPPALTAAELFAASPPVITFSNWRSANNSLNYCNYNTRLVDVSWGVVPNATYYDFYVSDINQGAGMGLYGTTTATSWPNFGLGTAYNAISPTEITVVAHDAAGDGATSTVRADQALADQQPPMLLADSMIPARYATGVPVTASIYVPFNEPLLLGSVQYPYSIELTQRPDRTIVPTTISLSPDGTTIILTPLQPLAYGTGYNLSMSCELSDLYGNQLPNGIAWFYDADPTYFTTEVQ